MATAQMMRVRAAWAGYSGGPGLSTFYFSGSNPVLAAEALEAVNRVRAVFSTGAGSIPIGTVVTVSPQVDILSPATGVLLSSISVAPPASVAGTLAGGPGSTANMALGRFGTAAVINGRKVQGRIFWGPLGVSDVAGGQVSGSRVSLVQGAILQAGITITTPITHCVWHRPDPVTHTGGDNPAVTGYTVRTLVAVLRSRRD